MKKLKKNKQADDVKILVRLNSNLLLHALYLILFLIELILN